MKINSINIDIKFTNYVIYKMLFDYFILQFFKFIKIVLIVHIMFFEIILIFMSSIYLVFKQAN